MNYINATGVSIFLDVPVAVLHSRMVSHAQHDRPLYSPDNPDLLRSLQERYETRLPFYSQATICIPGEPDEEEILRQVGEWL
jgi:shikimate kinase